MVAGSGESIRWSANPEKGSDSNASTSAEGSSKKEKKNSKSPSAETERHLPPEARERFGQIFARPVVNREIPMPWQQAEDKKKDGSAVERPAHEAEDEKKDSGSEPSSVAEAQTDTTAIKPESEATNLDQAAEAQAEEATEPSADGQDVESGFQENEVGEVVEVPLAATPEMTNGTDAPAELTPLDLPLYQPGIHGPNPAELAGGLPQHPASMHEGLHTPPWTLPEYNPQQHDSHEDYETLDNASPYTHAQPPQPMPGGGNAGQPPRANYAPGYNPNFMPQFNTPNVVTPLAAMAPAAANAVGLRARAHEVSNAFWGGVVAGLLGGALAGSALARRAERAKAERALAKQAHAHQVETAGYQAQLAEAQSRAPAFAARQEYAPSMAAPFAEAAAPLAATAVAHEAARQPFAASRIERQPAGIKTEAPKRVELMTDTEVHEASRNIKIGDKSLYELRENGTVTAADERKLLKLAEQGGAEDPAKKFAFDQEVQQVLRRHELDPMLAQQVMQRDLEAPVGQGQQVLPQDLQTNGSEFVSPLQLPSMPSVAPQPKLPVSSSRPPQALVIANIVAAGILGVLVVVLGIVWFTR